MADEEDDDCDDYSIKVILIGDSGVGKTNIINTSVGNEFNELEMTTTAASFSEKILEVNKKKCQLNLWDTIGQEKFRQLTRIFYNNSKIVIFVYDITRRDSFDALKDWYKDVEENIGSDIVRGVIANKMDLYFEEEVKQDEGEAFAKSINATFLAYSAKNKNIEEFDEFLVKLVKEYVSKEKKRTEGRFTLSRNEAFEEKKGNNCCK